MHYVCSRFPKIIGTLLSIMVQIWSEMSHNGKCVKIWSPENGAVVGWWRPWEVETIWRKLDHTECAPKGWYLFPSLCSSLFVSCQLQVSLPLPHATKAVVFYSIQDSKKLDQATNALKTLNLWAKISLPSF